MWFMVWVFRAHRPSQLWVVKLEDQWVLMFMLILLITPWSWWRFWQSHNENCLCLSRVITEGLVGDLSLFNYLSICCPGHTCTLLSYEDGARLIIFEFTRQNNKMKCGIITLLTFAEAPSTILKADRNDL